MKRHLLGALVLLGAAAARAQEAEEVLFRMRDAYAGLEAYRDEGEIEMEDRGAGGGVVRFTFSTAWAENRLSLRIAPAGAALANAAPLEVSRGGDRESALAMLGARLDEAVGSGAGAALWVPALLVGGPLAQPEPEALAVDGEEACGTARCAVLVGSEAGAPYRLWVGLDDHRLRRAEVELHRGAAVRVFRVAWRPLPALPATPAEGGVYAETIDVSLLSVVVRVHDGKGQAVSDLAPADFRLRWGGREVPVEAAEWVGESAPPSAPTTDTTLATLAAVAPPSPGRLLLFFVQTSFEPSRLSGHMRMRTYAARFLDDLRPDDRAAVVSFDSHLKLRCDFTADRERLREALEASMRPGPEPLLRLSGDPSLLRAWDREAAKRAGNPERGLELAARALIPIAGEKVVVFLGWGLGRYGANGVTMRPEYGDARRALEAAHATVFALDVTEADYHSLEVGLEQVAADTGGTYAKTHIFPQLAMNRLSEAMAGYYVLYFRRPQGSDTPERVVVDLRDRTRGEILAPEAIVR